MSRARSFLTLVRREAWEYRAWWTLILCGTVSMTGMMLCLMPRQLRSMGPETLAFQDAFFLRWNHGLFLGGAGLMALAHAAHAVFDERQDRSIWFWQAFPVPERFRLFSKSIAISLGWPLLAATADTCLTLTALVRSFATDNFSATWNQVLPTWAGMMSDCLHASAWAWPMVCIWLLCSCVATRSPWAWGWGCAGVVYLLAKTMGADPWRMGAAVALGPAFPALAGAMGRWAWLPWETGSVAWCLSYALGWGCLHVAAKQVGEAATARV